MQLQLVLGATLLTHTLAGSVSDQAIISGTTTEIISWTTSVTEPAGSTYEFTPDKDIGEGTCVITFPYEVIFFDIENAHVRVDAPSDANEFQFVAADMPYEPTAGPYRFTVNYGEGAEFTAKDIVVQCDSSDKYTFALGSFPETYTSNVVRTDLMARQGFGSYSSLTLHLGTTIRSFRVLHDTIKVEGYQGPNVYLYDIPSDTSAIWMEFEFIDYFTSNQVYIDMQEPSTTTGATTTADEYISETVPNGAPTCSPDQSVSGINWLTCALDSQSDVWYGISTGKDNFFQASKICTMAYPITEDGIYMSQLTHAKNADTDKCLYDILHHIVGVQEDDFDRRVLLGGRFDPTGLTNEYNWISSDPTGENPTGEPFQYTNWAQPVNRTTDGTCVTAVYGRNTKYYDQYGWGGIPCDEPAYYICRLDCGGSDPSAGAGNVVVGSILVMLMAVML